MAILWNVQIFDQGVLLETDVIEETEVKKLEDYYTRIGYEVRSELAFPPNAPLAE